MGCWRRWPEAAAAPRSSRRRRSVRAPAMERRGSRRRAGRRRLRRGLGFRRRPAGADSGSSAGRQSVSVVPMMVRAPAGMQKKRRLSPGVRSTSTRPSCGTRAASNTRCTPSVGRNRGGAWPASRPSVKGPAAVTMACARTSNFSFVSASSTAAPRARPRRSRTRFTTRQVVGYRRAGALGIEDVFQNEAGVVGLAVPVEMRPDQASRAQIGDETVELVGRDPPPPEGSRPSAKAL